MRAYTKEAVFACASGNYMNLAAHFCPELTNALKCPGRHVADPFKEKSKDGFRVLSDFNTSGRMVFNNNFGMSGKYMDFFQYLKATQRVTDFYQALELVGNYLSCPRTGRFLKGQAKLIETAEQKAQREKAMQEIKRQSQLLQEKNLREEQERFISNKKHIDELLKLCVPLDSDKAQEAWQYLSSRGLGVLKYAPKEVLKNISYVPHCPLYTQKGVDFSFGAIICKIFTTEGKLWSLHRTYLSNGAKANITSPKKIMPALFSDTEGSRYIPIGDIPEHGLIGIAEGLETALSVHLATRMTVYPTVNSGGIKGFIPPKGVKGVVVFADKDASDVGQEAARELVARLKTQGYKAFISYPKDDIPENARGIDWNDVLLTKGIYGFPDPMSLINYVFNTKQ